MSGLTLFHLSFPLCVKLATVNTAIIIFNLIDIFFLNNLWYNRSELDVVSGGGRSII